MNRYLSFVIILFIFLGIGFLFFKKNYNPDIQAYTPSTSIEEDNSQMEAELVSGFYTNKTYGFNMKVPSTLRATGFEEGGGNNVLIRGDYAGFKNFSMQVYISPFDEDISLDIARIKKDIPDMKMIDPIQIKTDGAPTVAFFSEDGGIKYRQIWFVHDYNLYQIITKAEQDDLTAKIMDTWKWVTQ